VLDQFYPLSNTMLKNTKTKHEDGRHFFITPPKHAGAWYNNAGEMM